MQPMLVSLGAESLKFIIKEVNTNTGLDVVPLKLLVIILFFYLMFLSNNLRPLHLNLLSILSKKFFVLSFACVNEQDGLYRSPCYILKKEKIVIHMCIAYMSE